MTGTGSITMFPSTISVIVPVYNGAATLDELIARINVLLMPCTRGVEIILVNDGSKDASWAVITRLTQQHPNVRGINLMHNYGQHNALLAGIRSARHDILVTIDDDLQQPPEEIPNLLAKLAEGYDVVYGKPRMRQHSLWRNITSRALKLVLRVVLGSEMSKHSSPFRAFRAKLRRGFANFADAHVSIDVLLSWSAANVTHVLIDHRERQVGRSGYTLSKLLRLAFSMLTGYSTLPLRIASSAGLMTALFGLTVFIYVIVRRLIQTNYVPGFAFVSAEIALFAGIQLFAIGIIGEYIARLHFRTMGKPAYVIDEELESSPLFEQSVGLDRKEPINSGPWVEHSSQSR